MCEILRVLYSNGWFQINYTDSDAIVGRSELRYCEFWFPVLKVTHVHRYFLELKFHQYVFPCKLCFNGQCK